MAGGKETPRQKMIGLMYLVLMALLAMNVSKEIINAFITLDNKLIEGNGAFVSKGKAAFSKIETADAQTGNDVTKFWYGKAKNVKGIADRMNDYIFDLKASMLTESVVPGGDINMWVNTAEDGTRTIKNLLDPENEYPKKDDYDTPSRMFGGEPGLPGYEKGAEIRTRIHTLRDSLIYELATHNFGGNFTFNIENGIADTTALQEGLKGVHKDDMAVITQLYTSLTQPETMLNHGKEQAWQVVMFDHAPVVAAAAVFSSIQNDVRNAEATAMEHLLSKVTVPPVKFNAVEAMAIGVPYVNQGDSLPIKVIVAAWDSSEYVASNYSIDEGESLNAKSHKGYAGVLAPSNSVGVHTVKGNVMVEVDGKKVPQPWSFNYTVGAPNASVSPSDLMVLYRGYQNKIEVSASGFPPESIKPSCSGCTIKKAKDGWIAVPSGKAKEATISVSASVDGKSTKIAAKKFRIFNLPTPNAYFVNQTFDKPTMKTTLAKKGTRLTAKLGDSPLNIQYTVSSFDMIVPAPGGKVRTLSSKSGSLTGEMKSAVKRMNRGSAVTFTNIKAVKKGSKKPQKLGSLVFRLI